MLTREYDFAFSRRRARRCHLERCISVLQVLTSFMMEAVSTSEKSVIFLQATQRNVLEKSHLHEHS